MCLELTNEDVLRAYKVYKSAEMYTKRIPDNEKDTYVILCTLLALYDGLSPLELQKVLMLTKHYTRKIISDGVTKYRIITLDKDLVLGRHTLCGTLSKGVLRMNNQMLSLIQKESMNPDKQELETFATVLSNTSTHVKIIRNNVKNLTNSSILSHISMLFSTVICKQLQDRNECLPNLARLGYMRIRNKDIELNKHALLYNKEPNFAIRTV